jgi:precorrin-3B synthase
MGIRPSPSIPAGNPEEHDLVTAHFRRGACPSLFEPMPTGDGLLARLPQFATPLPLVAFAELCALAEDCGNGIVEVTQRGSLQIRGLTSSSAMHLAEAAGRLGIERSIGPGVVMNPLAGLDPTEATDPVRFVAELEAALNAASFVVGLSPKVSVVVDGGGALHLDGLSADIRLRAETMPAGILFHVAVGGDANTAAAIGAMAPAAAIGAVLRLLARIAQYGHGTRARDILAAEGSDPFRSAVREMLIDVPPPGERPPAEPIGIHRLRDGRVAVGVGLTFGQAESAVLGVLARTAERLGASRIVPAERRSLIVTGLPPEAALSFIGEAERLGLVTNSGDPRRRIIACAGAPACAQGKMPARALGPAIAAAAGLLLDGSLQIHISGCAKGCANPGTAALAFVGGEGRCGLVVDGSARTTPRAVFDAASIPARIAHLAEATRDSHQPGEPAAEVLARLGADRVAALIMADPGR